MARPPRASLLLALCLCFICSNLVLTSAKKKHHAPPPPEATLASGTIFSGSIDEKNNIAYWQGVRYTKPPTGILRFAPPQPIDDATQNTPALKPSASSGGHAGQKDAALSLRPLAALYTLADVAQGASVAAAKALDASFRAAKTYAFTRRQAPGIVNATYTGPECPQDGNIKRQNEDCLFLNIYKPYSSPDNASLPVLIFIHGGGFQSGAGSQYDPAPIIEAGNKAGAPVMIITINYRLNVFGFLASSDLADLAGLNPSGCFGNTSKTCTTEDVLSEPVGLNLGYQDSKMAINWTYTNIAAFGGDPSRITIWGQSAGAFTVGAQLVGHRGTALPSGQTKNPYPPRPLFRGAIMMSGSPSGPALAFPSEKDNVWNRTLVDTRCDGPEYATAQARVNCLRAVDWVDLRQTGIDQNDDDAKSGHYDLGAYPFTQVYDGGAARGGFYRKRGSELLAEGRFASVPLISGDCEDEGTIFAPHRLNNSADTEAYIAGTYFENGTATDRDAVWNAIATEYPDDPVVGSPFTPVGAPPTDRFYRPLDANQYKRAAAIYGDIRFQSNRRWLLQQGIATGTTPASWSYAYQEPAKGEKPALGVPHSSDLNKIFASSKATALSTTMALQWIAFATSLDPNGAGLPDWPQYDLTNLSLISYQNEETVIIRDDYREDPMNVLNSEAVRAITGR